MEKTIQLKNYQKKALHEINVNYANGTKSQLLVMATGTGKTVVFCEFIKELISVEKKVLILVHRDELINQAERRLKLHTSEPFGIEKAERKANNENIVLASVQTLKGKRLKKFAKDYFDVIVIDECHRSTANSYMTVRNHFKKSHVLGVTATPERQDDLKITKKHFQKIAFTYNLLDAIKEGNLANIRVWRVESEQDISDVKSNSDDLDQRALAKVLDNDEYLEFIYKTITEKAFNKKIMVFMPSVKMSDKLADLLNSKGLSAFSVNSNTPLEKRQEVLEDYKTGKIKVLSNYNIFTEGFDEPSIDCVVMARPTKSEIFYSQALGRMTRLFEGKEYGMLIDIGFVNNTHRVSSIFNLIESKEDLPIEVNSKLSQIYSKYSNGSDLRECLINYKKESLRIIKEYKKKEKDDKERQEKFAIRRQSNHKKRLDNVKRKYEERKLLLTEISIQSFFKSFKFISSNIKFMNENKKEFIEKAMMISKEKFKKVQDIFVTEKNAWMSFTSHTISLINVINNLEKDNKYLQLQKNNIKYTTPVYASFTNHNIIFPATKKAMNVYYELINKPHLYWDTKEGIEKDIKTNLDGIKYMTERKEHPSWVKTDKDIIKAICQNKANIKRDQKNILKLKSKLDDINKKTFTLINVSTADELEKLIMEYGKN